MLGHHVTRRPGFGSRDIEAVVFMCVWCSHPPSRDSDHGQQAFFSSSPDFSSGNLASVKSLLYQEAVIYCELARGQGLFLLLW